MKLGGKCQEVREWSQRNPDRMGDLSEFELRSVTFKSAWTHGGSQCCGGLSEAIASIVSARSLCDGIDLDVGCLLPSILKFAAFEHLMILRDASLVFSAGFEGWIVGQLPTAILIIHWPQSWNVEEHQ